MAGELIPNSVIHNRYVIESHIGRGGMSDVYRAIQKELNRPVALKVMRSDTAWDKNALARFKQEALSVAKLEHPNIVSVYDYGEYEGNPFMVFRFVGGGSIKQHMTSPGDPALVYHWIRQISSALDYAHSKGIVHRDLKPDNVLMTEDGTLLLSDFGISKLLEDDSGMTKTGSGFGTPHYMSPEQALGKKVDHRTDIYALGIMLFQMLTGRLPFNADTSYGVVMKHATEPVPQIGNQYDAIILKSCAKNPDERYQTCGALVADLASMMKRAGVNIDKAVAVPVAKGKASNEDDASPTIEIGGIAPKPQPSVAPAPVATTHYTPAPQPTPLAQPVPAHVPIHQSQQAPVFHTPVNVVAPPAAPSGTKTAFIASASVVVVVGLLAVGGGAAWYFAREKEPTAPSTSVASASTPAQQQSPPPQAAGNEIRNERQLNDLMLVANTRYFSEADLAALTPWELTILRNSTYARHGRKFRRVDLQNYFNKQTWYRADPNYSDALLNEIEKRNSAFVNDYQQRNGKTN